MLSVIVPIYNEEKVLYEKATQFQELTKESELIFIDGGSSDKSAQIAERYGKVLHSEKGRAIQMNFGADSAKGEILLFLHADSSVSPHTTSSIEKAVRDDGAIGGCLTQSIKKDGRAYRFIENFGNCRARLTKVFYGDQGIFVRKDIFLKMGGFPAVPIMEDVIFSRKMRKLGRTRVLTDEILVSPRRWEEKGILRTAILYSTLNILFWLRAPLSKITSLYGDLR